jgi:hypothetical protein
MINSRLINTKVAGGGCTDIVDNYDPFGGGGVALYQLNGNATDVSGNYNGTATSVTYGTGVFGQAGVFNGSTSQISFNNIGFPSTTMTVSAWIKPSSTFLANGISGIVAWGNSASGQRRSLVYYQGGQIGFSGYFAASNFTGTTVLPTEQWSHIAFTLTGGIVTLYINGAFEDSGAVALNAYSSTTAYIGTTEVTSTNEHFNGSIDQTRVFNTVLTPLEVEALYTEELCICGGTVDTLDILDDSSCIALYPLDGNANDLSGNYSGTPTNVSYGVGEFDLAGVFNGSSGRVQIPSLFPSSYTSSVSFSCWFKTSVNDANLRTIIEPGEINSSGNFTAYYVNGVLRLAYYNLDGSGVSDGGTNIADGNWHNLVAVLNNLTGNLYFYLDGNNTPEISHTFTSGSIINTFSNQISHIGAAYYQPIGYFRFMNGSIDQVRIFNKALNSTEVTTLYNETACTYTPAYEPIIEDATDPFGDGSEYALYEFDNNVIDSEGSYNGLASGNVAYTAGVFGQAINLTGTNASVEIPNFSTSDFSNKNVSVSCWVNMQSLVGASSKGAHLFIVASGSWAIQVSTNGISMHKYLNGSNFYNLYYPITVNLNEWYHIVATDSTSTGMKIYVNGIIVASVNYTGAIDLTYNDIGWGYYNGYQDRRGFTGYVDQGRIFNKTLTASEVYALYNE